MSNELVSEFTSRNAGLRADIDAGEYAHMDDAARFRDISARLGIPASPVASVIAKHVEQGAVFHGEWANRLLAERAQRAMEKLSHASTAAACEAATDAEITIPVADFATCLADATARMRVTSGVTKDFATSLADATTKMRTGTKSETVEQMTTAVSAEARAVARRTISDMIRGIRFRRQTMKPLAKFVSKGATIYATGPAESDAKPVFSTVKQLIAIGLISSFAITLVPSEAEARKRDRLIAIAGGIAAGLAANNAYGMMNGNGGAYLPAGGYPGANYPAPAYPAPQPLYRPDPYLSGGYDGVGYGPQYRRNPVPMSDQMTIAAKSVVAISIGSVRRADAIVDQAIQQGMNCVRRFGPDSRCLMQTNGVVMDFGRGNFTATLRGTVIAHENNRMFSSDNRILRRVWDEAKQIKAAEDGYGYGQQPYRRY